MFADNTDEYHFCHVLLKNNTIIGYFDCLCAADELHILNLAVAAKHQHNGYGQVILDKIIRIAHERHLSALILEVRTTNIPAVALYKKNGFAELYCRKRYYRDGTDAYVMALLLNAT